MGKVNVYLPDDLEGAVRAAGLSISPICQEALRAALDRLVGVRTGDAVRGRLAPRLAAIIDAAKAELEQVTATDLVGHVARHGENLGARALRLLGVDLPTDAVRRSRPPVDGELDSSAQDLLVDAYKVALDMRHDHVGTEHVVIAAAERDDLPGTVLAALGISPRAIRTQVEKLLANPWTEERVATEHDPALLARLEDEVHRLAAELGRLRAPDGDP